MCGYFKVILMLFCLEHLGANGFFVGPTPLHLVFEVLKFLCLLYYVAYCFLIGQLFCIAF